jgi:hypothetical protein
MIHPLALAARSLYHSVVSEVYASRETQANIRKEPAIKGPSARTRHDVRRVWECPACKRRDWTNGNVVHLLCQTCATKAEAPAEVWMQLIEPQRKTPGR